MDDIIAIETEGETLKHLQASGLYLGNNVYLYQTESGNLGVRIQNNDKTETNFYSIALDGNIYIGENIIASPNFKHYNSVEYTKSNVAVTTKSGNGAYYGTLVSLSDLNLTDFSSIFSIVITNWTGAVASFTPYYQSNEIKIMSDVSQTLGSVTVKIGYAINSI